MDPDLPLIESIKAGNDAALNELMHRYQEPLFRFALRYMGDEIASRDVVHETFVRVYFKAGKFKPKATVKTWIYTITLNLCRDQSRRLSRWRTSLSLDARCPDALPSLEIADPALSPVDQAGQAEGFLALRAAVDRLPHKLKSALVLFSLEGHSQKEAAELLGTTPKTVELRVARAKQKLREMLTNELAEDQLPRDE